MQSIPRKVPGIFNFGHTLDSLKTLYPNNVTLFAGDIFGASYFCKVTNSAIIPDMMQYLGADISVLGNHEFDEGQAFLSQCFYDSATNWHLTYLMANLTINGEIPNWVKPAAALEIKISENKTLSIAVVGLMSHNVLMQTALEKNVKGVEIDNDYKKVLTDLENNSEYSKMLQNADIRVLLTHLPTDTDTLNATRALLIDDGNLAQSEYLLSRYPYYSALFTAHSHKAVKGYVDKYEMPVLQGKNNGLFISMQLMDYDTVKNQVTKVYPPELVPVNNHPVHLTNPKDIALENKIKAAINQYDLNKICIQASDALVHERDAEHFRSFTGLAAYCCRSLAEEYRKEAKDKTNSVIALYQFGGVRTSIKQGGVERIDVGEIMPFCTQIDAYDVTGKELKDIFNIGLNLSKNDKGWLQTNNLVIDIDTVGEDFIVKQIFYKDDNGKIVPISDENNIVVVADTFLAVDGGDYSLTKYFKKHKRRLEKDETITFTDFIENLGKNGVKLTENNDFKVVVK
ncbi:2',3'-cyclic-nucleotide 2'-phosphodiesterase [Bacteroidia bacterium]|nr:2',3'-cyclic-nucleotide 2'-phosphodiesterase [Bacteroidia bacterium]